MPTGNPWDLRVCCEKAAAASTPPAKGMKLRRVIFMLLRMRMISLIKQSDFEQLFIFAEDSEDSAVRTPYRSFK
jgi:hypothetical protein